MKKSALFLLATLLAAFLNFGCNDYSSQYDDVPPSKPSNVYVIAGDNRVDIDWDRNYERDVAGYNIYISNDDYKFELIGSSEETYFVDDYARNGNIYYYAVTAYDYNGNESDLSIEELVVAPRPEGFDKVIFDYLRFPNQSGYSFAEYRTVAYDSKYADFFFENYYGVYYLDVWEDTDIQDMGPTRDIWDISEAPQDGWSETKDEMAIVGHTYVIWTVDNHYAKIRITNITNDRIVFDWAYQSIEGVRLLKDAKHGTYETRILNKDFLKSKSR